MPQMRQPPGSVFKTRVPGKVLYKKSPISPSVSIPRAPKRSLGAVERVARNAQRVGQLKISAKREEVEAHTRKAPSGRVVHVRSYSRKGEREDKIEQFRKREERRRRQAEDLEAWKEWKASGKDPKKLRPLLKRFKPMIETRAKAYRGKVPIPPAAVDAEFKKQFVRALNTYQPEKGALGTWVYQYLEAAKRFIAKYQNPMRIPEERIYLVGDFYRAHEYLDDLYGRPATPKELSDYVRYELGKPKATPKAMALLEKELRKSVPRSAFEEDPTVVAPSRQKEVLDLIWYELSPEEKLVYDHMRGTHGRQLETRPGKIAKMVGMSNSKVSRLRASIAEKIDKYLR